MLTYKLYTSRKRKQIDIIEMDDGKREIVAHIPYHGGRYSFNYLIRESIAQMLMEYYREQRLEMRRTTGEKVKRFSIGAPWINETDSPNLVQTYCDSKTKL